MYVDAHNRDVDLSERFAMFGHYIQNNIGIAFRTFAGGIFAGVGSLFFMLLNGFFIGAIFGHLGQMPYSHNLFSFVCTHGAFELTAIVLAGVAGCRIGLAVIAPGPWSRREALRQAGERTLPIVYGMTVFLVLAAAIEAFYSPFQINLWIKYPLAFLLWTAVFAYLGLAGRTHES
nr:stage II sporulation protein M [Acanthopleuribacter pedis]